MINTHNLSNFPSSNLFPHLSDPSNHRHSEIIITQLALKDEHIVPRDTTEEHLYPHLLFFQLRQGEGLWLECACLKYESCCFLIHFYVLDTIGDDTIHNQKMIKKTVKKQAQSAG